MLQKANKVLCICSVILAMIQLGAAFLGQIQMLQIMPNIVFAGVCVSAVSWIAAQWKCDDAAIRTATIALVIFLVSEAICVIQMFLLLKILL